MRLEEAAVVVVLLLYARRTSLAGTFLCLGVLAAHFSLLAWVLVGHNTWKANLMSNKLFLAEFVLLPFCTILVWGVYSKMVTVRSRSSERFIAP